MALQCLTAEEQEIVRRMMAATFHYFDFDFHTRLGVTPEEMRSLLDIWPMIDDSDDGSITCLAINNSLNDLLYGQGISAEEALEFAGSTREEIERAYRRWSAARGWRSTGVR